MTKPHELWIKYRGIGLGALVMSGVLISLGYVLDPRNMGYVNWLGIIGFSVGLIGLFVSLNDIDKKVEDLILKQRKMDALVATDTTKSEVQSAIRHLQSKELESALDATNRARESLLMAEQTYMLLKEHSRDLYNTYLENLTFVVKLISETKRRGAGIDEDSGMLIHTKLDATIVYLTRQRMSLSNTYASRSLT